MTIQLWKVVHNFPLSGFADCECALRSSSNVLTFGVSLRVHHWLVSATTFRPAIQPVRSSVAQWMLNDPDQPCQLSYNRWPLPTHWRRCGTYKANQTIGYETLWKSGPEMRIRQDRAIQAVFRASRQGKSHTARSSREGSFATSYCGWNTHWIAYDRFVSIVLLRIRNGPVWATVFSCAWSVVASTEGSVCIWASSGTVILTQTSRSLLVSNCFQKSCL